MGTPVPHLSYSSVSSFMRCSRSWQLHYIEHLPQAPKGSLLAGNVYHKAVAWGYEQALATGLVPVEEEMKDVTASFWDTEVMSKSISDPESGERVGTEAILWDDDMPPGEFKDRVVTMVSSYMTKIAPLYRPLTIEQKYTMQVDGVGVPVIGFSDLTAERSRAVLPASKLQQASIPEGEQSMQETWMLHWLATAGIYSAESGSQCPYTLEQFLKPLIVDHKMRERSASDAMLANDFQSTFYTMMTGHQTTEFHESLNQKKLNFKVKVVHRSEADFGWCRTMVRDVWEQMCSGLYAPNPFSFFCSPEDCSYYAVCRMGMR